MLPCRKHQRFGIELVKFREKHELTQESLANKIGISQPTISKAEGGREMNCPIACLILDFMKDYKYETKRYANKR